MQIKDGLIKKTTPLVSSDYYFNPSKLLPCIGIFKVNNMTFLGKFIAVSCFLHFPFSITYLPRQVHTSFPPAFSVFAFWFSLLSSSSSSVIYIIDVDVDIAFLYITNSPEDVLHSYSQLSSLSSFALQLDSELQRFCSLLKVRIHNISKSLYLLF